MTIQINLDPLESTAAFPYLGRTITFKNYDWVALYGNMGKAQQRWGMVTEVLTKIGEMVRSQEMMYEAVFHTLLL